MNNTGLVAKSNNPKDFSVALKKLVIEKKNRPKFWTLKEKKMSSFIAKKFRLNRTMERFNNLV